MKTPDRVLITGATGCAGSHLSELALARGCRVFGIARRGPFVPGVKGRLGDVSRREEVADWLARCRPDRVFHLAALVHGSGAHSPEDLLRVNVGGTHVLLEAVRETVPEARVLVAVSSGIYGESLETGRPIVESAPFEPRSLYAVTKAAQDLMAAQFFRAYGLHTVRARTFNQTGPREPKGLVCATVARQVARIEAGLQLPVLRVIELRSRRDFCDVRDVVAGYWAALESGAAGEAYNICSGKSHGIREVVDLLLAMARVPAVTVEEARPSPDPGAVHDQTGDFSRLNARAGWAPVIPFEASLRDLLDEWRLKVRSGA
ncbi:MAG: GDP-mannose 4,6-dehydratase [Thermoanaerobaculia bacterium]